jgi:hypothetical protein
VELVFPGFAFFAAGPFKISCEKTLEDIRKVTRIRSDLFMAVYLGCTKVYYGKEKMLPLGGIF